MPGKSCPSARPGFWPTPRRLRTRRWRNPWRPAGSLRVNNGEALMPALLAWLGIADLPDFIVGDAIASGEVEVILKDWKQTEGSVHLVTPPGGPRPARVEVLADFLTKHFASTKKRK